MQQNAHFADPGTARARIAGENWHYPEEATHPHDTGGTPPADPPAPGRRRLSWPDRLLLFVVAVLFAGLHLRADASPGAAHAQAQVQVQAQVQAAITLDEVTSGTLLIRGPQGRLEPITQLRTQVTFDVAGPLVRTSVKQAFLNDSNAWVEGTYVFPLPDEAAVDTLRLVVGNRIIEGEIQERQAARRSYETARDAGQVASLVEQERPNLFTASVANIGPGEEILIEIGYQQILKPSNGVFELRFPLTLTRRYVPPPARIDDTVEDLMEPARLIEKAIDAARVTPPVATSDEWEHPVVISVHLDLGGLTLTDIRSHHHEIIIDRDKNDLYTVILGEPTVPADRDFLLSWVTDIGSTPEAAVFTETIGDERFALVMLMPPEPALLPAVPPRDLIFVIDTSGSMHGESIRQAREALIMALDRLGPSDRFDIIEFNSQARSLFGEVLPANAYFIRTAQQFVGALRADGGTNIAAALGLALDKHVETQGRLRQVVFITDGSVSAETQLLEQISRDLGDARLFTIGIGSAPNTWFMRQAATFGRGTYTFIDSISDVGEQLEVLFAKLELPALTELETHWSIMAESFPNPVPDVYAGEPVIVTARLPAEWAYLDLTGITAQGEWLRRIYLDGANDRPGIARLWARAKIEDFENLQILGADKDMVRESIVDTALKYGLVSKYTSLVAVDKTPVRLASLDLTSEMLPNLAPAGTTVAMAATATPARLWLLIGLVCFVFTFGWTALWARA